MSYVFRNGLLVPRPQIVANRKAAHIRVPRAEIILRRPSFPIHRPIVGAVVLDSLGTRQHKVAALSFTYTGLTIGAGLSNSAAVFAVCLNGGTATFTVPQWNGVTCPQIGTVTNPGNNGQVAWFGIVNPASGNKSFTVTSSLSKPVNIGGWSFSGVDQTGGATSFAHFTSNTDGGSAVASVSITVTTTSGNYTLAACECGVGNGPTGTLTNGASIAEDWEDNTDVGTQGVLDAAGKAASTGASLVWTAHNSSNDAAFIAGFDIVAAAATGWVASNKVTRNWLSRRGLSGSVTPR